jgi:uncharacterized membrane protein
VSTALLSSVKQELVNQIREVVDDYGRPEEPENPHASRVYRAFVVLAGVLNIVAALFAVSKGQYIDAAGSFILVMLLIYSLAFEYRLYQEKMRNHMMTKAAMIFVGRPEQGSPQP